MPSGAELAQAWVRLTPSLDGAQGEIAKGLGGVDSTFEEAGKKSGSRFTAGFKMLAVAGAAAAAAGLVKIFNVGFEELKFGEELNAQTDILVKNTGFAMKTSEINDYTLALSKISGISEEELQGAGNQLLKFGNLNEETYKRAVDSINDMGAAGKDVSGVSVALGKALADPANAAALLKRQGVLLNEEQQKMIDNFTAAGDTAGAQGIILDALNSTYDGMAEKTGGTLQGNINKLTNSFENLAGDLVAYVMPAIIAVVNGFQSFIDWIGNNQATFGILVAALAALTVGVIAYTVAQWAMNSALLANPLTWVIAAIIALIAAIALLVVNWDAVVAWISQVWAGFISWITSVIDGFITWWNGVWAGFAAWINDLWTAFTAGIRAVWLAYIAWVVGNIAGFIGWWNGIWSGFAAWINQLWTGFTNFLRNIWSGYIAWVTGNISGFVGWWNGIWSAVGQFIQNTWNNFTAGIRLIWAAVAAWLQGAINGFVGFWSGVWNNVASIASGLWNNIRSVISSAWSGIQSFLQGAINGFVGWWNSIWGTVGNVIRSVFSGIAGFIGGVWDGIVGRVRGAVNSIVGAINGMIGAINGILGAVGKLTGIKLNIPKIPGLATGGSVTRGGTVLVGENGPELLHLPKGAQVESNEDSFGPRRGGIIFNNYAPLGQNPSQALSQFANRAAAGGLL